MGSCYDKRGEVRKNAEPFSSHARTLVKSGRGLFLRPSITLQASVDVRRRQTRGLLVLPLTCRTRRQRPTARETTGKDTRFNAQLDVPSSGSRVDPVQTISHGRMADRKEPAFLSVEDMPPDRGSALDDKFAPPGLGSDEPMELAAHTPPPRPATLAEPNEIAPEHVIAASRKPVKYKGPDAGFPTYVFWALAAVGLGVVVIGGARLLRRSVEGPDPAEAAQAAAAAPVAKPVQWKSVGKGDEVLVTIEIAPKAGRKARLLLDGAPLASNPVLLARGSKHTVSAVADGFEPASLDVTADAPKAIRLELRRSGKR